MKIPIRLLAAAILAAWFAPLPAQGPGLGNLTYAPSERFQPVSVIVSPGGHGSVAMVNGYLMVIYGSDGGGSANEGGIEFWDVSDPRTPILVRRYDDSETHGLREPHGFGFSNGHAGDYLVAQAIEGIQFWDVSDPLNLALLSYLDLPGITQGNYSGAWWVFWQAPWVFVAGTGSGLYVVDGSDPTDPRLVRHLPTGEIGGLSPGQVFALGNLLVLAEDQGSGYATMEIGDPSNPVLLDHHSGSAGYSHLFAAGKILTSGGNGGANAMGVHDVGHDGSISFVGSVGSGLANGGYGSYQDGIFHSGFSNRYEKFDVASLTQLGGGSSGIPERDEDFGIVLGNLVFVGNDHGQGSALIVHDTVPDSSGPDVHWVHPADDATGQSVAGRVGVSMSDSVNLESVDATTFAVRRVGGSPLPGKYSSQMGLVNFSPDSPFVQNTTYEVVVHGIRDLVGNAGGNFTSSFTTGAYPLPSCTLDPQAPIEVGTLGSFDAGSVDGFGSLLYSWDFGDGGGAGAPQSSSPATHVFASPGRYSITLTVSNETGSSACSAVQIVHAPLTPLPPTASSPLACGNGLCFNVNPDNGTVSAIWTANASKLWEAPVGERPRSLALAPDGNVWVACQGDSTIRVIAAANGAPLATIDLPFASQPRGVVFRPDGAAVYVTLLAGGRLLELDLSGNPVDEIVLGPRPDGIAISGDSSRILVTRRVSPTDRGEVWEIDAGSLTLARTFDLAPDPGPDSEASGRGVPNYVTSVRISPDGSRALVPSKKDNVGRGLYRDGQPLTFESRVRTIVSTLDLLAGSEQLGSRLDLNDRDMARTVAFSPLGDLFLVASQGSNLIDVYDANSLLLIDTFASGLAPQGMVFSEDGTRLYVHNFLSRSISIFDTTELIQGTGNSTVKLAEVPVVAQEPLTGIVLEGKRVFYNASDPRMSRDGYLSCASCHLEGGSDGRVWDLTQTGEGLRNTIDLTGRGGTDHGNLHWTANFDEIQDFENDIRAAFSGDGFLTEAEFTATGDPLGPPKAGLSAELDALSAYVASLDSFADSPHRNPDGSLTAAGVAGQSLFASRGCASCHSGIEFTDGLRHDVGTILPSSGQGIGQPLDGVGFETPTLKGLWDSAPYLHDGRTLSLADVLDSAEHGATDTLGTAERDELVSYLLQVDDRESAADPDADGVLGRTDNCPEVANPTQQDGDLDGRGDACDCAPLDPVAFAIPPPIEGLVLSDDGDLTWLPPPAGSEMSFEVYRESESRLVVGSGTDGTCLAQGLGSPTVQDGSVPLPGAGYRYLVRAENVCGAGSWGDDSSSTPRNVPACP